MSHHLLLQGARLDGWLNHGRVFAFASGVWRRFVAVRGAQAAKQRDEQVGERGQHGDVEADGQVRDEGQ